MLQLSCRYLSDVLRPKPFQPRKLWAPKQSLPKGDDCQRGQLFCQKPNAWEAVFKAARKRISYLVTEALFDWWIGTKASFAGSGSSCWTQWAAQLQTWFPGTQPKQKRAWLDRPGQAGNPVSAGNFGSEMQKENCGYWQDRIDSINQWHWTWIFKAPLFPIIFLVPLCFWNLVTQSGGVFMGHESSSRRPPPRFLFKKKKCTKVPKSYLSSSQTMAIEIGSTVAHILWFN